MNQLDRFTRAQADPHSGFEAALAEIKAGGKRGHWIWYVFPQLSGLGMSHMSQEYGIGGLDEARGYLRDDPLRERLTRITGEVAERVKEGVPLTRLMGSAIDVQKLISSLTLFGHIAGTAEPKGDYTDFAASASAILAAAESQGHPRCEHTRRVISAAGPAPTDSRRS